MKTKLTIALCILSLILRAQNKPSELNNLTGSAAKIFADQIASTSETKWEFLSAQANSAGTYYIVKYINANLPKDVKEGVKNGDSCDDCMKVVFSVGADKTMKFNEVWGKYSDLFPTWKKIFRPDADDQKTTTDFQSQELIDKPAGINFKFKKEQESWHIVNWS